MINATATGTVGRDAELTHTPNGTAKLRFSLASKQHVKDGDDVTTWVSCSMFGQRAAALAPHVLKGTRLVVIGRLRVWEHDGKAQVGVDVSELDFMGQSGQPRSKPRADEQRPTPPRSQHPAQAQLTDDGYDDCPF